MSAGVETEVAVAYQWKPQHGLLSSKQRKKVFNQTFSGVQPGAGAAILGNDPSPASGKNQWGIMNTTDCTEELHQLSALDRVDGLSRRLDAVTHSSLLDASDHLPEDKAVECCEGSGTPSPNVESLMGSLLTVGLDGDGYEVTVPKEHDEKQTILEPIMQSPEVQYADGDPTGYSEVGFSNEASPPGPPATLFVHHISGPCAEVDISHGLVRDVSLELPHPGVEMNMAPCCSPAGHDGCAGCALSAEDCVLPLPHFPAPLVNHQNLNTLIEDLDSTPESIARLTCKYNLVQSASEIVGNSVLDVNDSIYCCPDIDSTQPHVKSDVTVDGSDPLSRAIQLLTKVEVLRPSLDALTLEHKIMVLLFLDNCWCNVSDQMKDEFKKSFSCDGVSLLSSVDAPLEALRWTVLAHPHIGSLSMNEKHIIFDFLRSLMNLLLDSLFDHFYNLDDLVDGLHERRKMEVFKNNTGAVQNSEWSIAKSKRKRNNASKTSIGFPANR